MQVCLGCFRLFFFVCSWWTDGGQSETVLRGWPLRGMHAWRLGLSVPQPVSSQASGLHTCGSPVCFDTSDAVSLNNTSFILAIKLITPSPSHQLSLPPTPLSWPTLFYVLLFWDTGSFEVNRSLLRLLLLLWLCCFTLLLVLAEKSTRKCLKLGSTSFFVSHFLFLTFVRAAPNVWVMRCNRLLAFIHYDLAPLSHAWFFFLFSISSA